MDKETILKEVENKVPRRVGNIEMIDGKVKAYFSGSDPMDNSMYGYWEYEKIFNTWNEFSKYAQDFFKLT